VEGFLNCELRIKNYEFCILILGSKINMIQKLFSDKVIDFNRQLNYSGELPLGFKVINPFFNNPETMEVMSERKTVVYRQILVGISFNYKAKNLIH